MVKLLRTKKELYLLKERLIPFLRLNSGALFKVYGLLKSTLEDRWTDHDFFVDEWPVFSTIIARPKTDAEIKFSSHQHYYFTFDNTNLVQMLLTPGLIDWDNEPEFFCIPEDLKPYFEHVFKEKKKHFYYYLKASLYPLMDIPPLSHTIARIPVPPGLRLSSLEPRHVEKAVSTWKFGTPDAIDYVKHLIKNFPSSCLLDENDKLVALSLTYQNGSSGMLFVEPEHRGRGYSKLICRDLAVKQIKNGNILYGKVEISNIVCHNLQKSMGLKEGEVLDRCIVVNDEMAIPKAKL